MFSTTPTFWEFWAHEHRGTLLQRVGLQLEYPNSHSQSSNHSSLEYPNLFTGMHTGYTQSSKLSSLEYLLLDLQLGTLLQGIGLHGTLTRPRGRPARGRWRDLEGGGVSD